MLTQEELDRIKTTQDLVLSELIGGLRKIIMEDDLAVAQEAVKRVAPILRNSLSQTRNVVFAHKEKFAELGNKTLARLYNEEFNVLGEILVVFGKRQLEKSDLKLLARLYVRLLNAATAIEEALAAVEPRDW